MPAEIIDGNRLAKLIRSETRRRVKKLKFTPGIAVVQVGNDLASTIYVNYKQKDCERVHFHSEVYRMSQATTQEEVIDQMQTLNDRKEIHAILAQMPVPDQIDGQTVIDTIAPEKDTDGLGAANLGNLMINRECVLPCTPAGIVRLIESTGEEIEGKQAVCVGRSSLVGKPMGLILLNRNATVTYCHSRTRDLREQTRNADILVVATGKPEMIKADMVKEGAIVIDVGINRHDNRLIGDVDYENVKEVAGFITPVPGGVGPMTRAILLENTLKLAIAQCG
jgi:methylenetetrahydrofolate dehydrogenase (NADP+)/methenyltetrahydrofolate cyclohydrolase